MDEGCRRFLNMVIVAGVMFGIVAGGLWLRGSIPEPRDVFIAAMGMIAAVVFVSALLCPSDQFRRLWHPSEW